MLTVSNRPGSTRQWRKLRALVLERDGLRCRRPDCRLGTGHQLTTHDPRLETHATLGHATHAWIDTGQTSTNPDDYRAECSSSNYADGARITNARRAGLNTSRQW